MATTIKKPEQVLWISRHEPTAEQLNELREAGFEIAQFEVGQSIGRKSVDDRQAVVDFLDAVSQLAAATGATRAYGVWPVAIQEQLTTMWAGYLSEITLTGSASKSGVSCYAAWNVQCSVEGGKPTFTHKQFCFVGFIRASTADAE